VAQQALEQATSGPEDAEVNAVRLQVDQAEIMLEQSRFNLQLAEDELAEAELAEPGAMVGAGAPVVTLLDAERLSSRRRI